MRVLVVENDDRVARALARTLSSGGYVVERVTGVAAASKALASGEFGLALVDLGLADGDGVEVIRMLRDRTSIGVIAVTARGAETDRVRGLRAGADDYLVKPFGAAELLARMEAVTRRLRVAQAVPASQGVLEHGLLRVDLDRHEVFTQVESIPLTRKEFDLFALMLRSVGSVVPREHILDQVWHSTWEGSTRTLDTHMTSLRGKLGELVTITTVRGVGYRLEAREPVAVARQAPSPSEGDDGPLSGSAAPDAEPAD